MILRNILLPGVVTPAVATLLALLLLRIRRGPGAAGAALAVGYLAAFVAISGWPRWPPIEATQRLLFVVVGAGVAAWLVAPRRHRWMELTVEVASIALLLPLILWALVEHAWSPLESALWLTGLFVAALGLNRAMGASLAPPSNDTLPAAVRLVLIVGVATALGLSESLRLAQLGGALACGIGVIELCVRRRLVTWSRSDAVVVTTILTGLVVVGHFYAGLAGAPAILLLLALLLLGLPDTGPGWIRLIPLAPLLLALALVIGAFLDRGEDPYGDYSRLREEAEAVLRSA